MEVLIEKIVDNLTSNGILNEDICYVQIKRRKTSQTAYRMKINVVAGSEQYPLKRILKAKDAISRYSKLVRICGDSHLYSQYSNQRYKTRCKGEIDFITNTRWNFPSGQSVNLQYKMSNSITRRDELAQKKNICQVIYEQNAREWKVKILHRNQKYQVDT